MIPLSLANEDTKIVLAGDHMQLDPPVYSDIARKYGLHVSLLERLYDSEVFESGVGQLCKTLLTENHRSHHLVGNHFSVWTCPFLLSSPDLGSSFATVLQEQADV